MWWAETEDADSAVREMGVVVLVLMVFSFCSARVCEEEGGPVV